MRNLSLALLALAASAAATGAVARPVTAQVSPAVVSSDQFPKARPVFAGGVTGHPDLVYSTLPGFRPMTLDLYTPPKAGGAKPLVIYVHGGGWVNGTARNAGAFTNFPAVLADLAARGYVVASLNYRLAGEARAPAASQDVDAAIRWLKAHAADYGIDKSRVAIWGGSAGGQLAGLAATDCTAADGKGESDCVQSAVIWYGVFDFTALPAGPPPAPGATRAPGGPGGYLGCAPAECPDVARAQSPIAHVDAKTPPMLLIYGAEDRTVPPDQSRAMAARLKAAGVRSAAIELPGADHSFIGHTPAGTRAASLKALQATFDWFDQTLGRR
ncbi:alpha/beta hydrolase [Phenylobacterium soli]|uniref:Alpha/beta hydrolase n=1 Tax=Phenylobacterium soli TaxID=2170551 RepID=A0A328AC94_9CAUL|nr:alpha/beta hydrolase [Phenylobacterium soli]RAK51816.1 alpha/beta hydrolase [Phenylobacterium soli]